MRLKDKKIICNDRENKNYAYNIRVGPYRFFFYAGDRLEPPHIHVERDDKVAKFWLGPIRLQNSGGFRRSEINNVRHIVEENQQSFLEEWHEFFSN